MTDDGNVAPNDRHPGTETPIPGDDLERDKDAPLGAPGSVGASVGGSPAKPTVTVERLRELLDYNPLTGVFTWLVSRGRNAKAGHLAGSVRPDGYIRIMIDRRKYFAHRLAWLYVYGVWPADEIDHVNGDPSDNRIVHLREATRPKNLHNVVAPNSDNNTSGHRGVSWDKSRGKWQACIQVDGHTKHLGRFTDLGEASAAYFAAKDRHHGGAEWYGGRTAHQQTGILDGR